MPKLPDNPHNILSIWPTRARMGAGASSVPGPGVQANPEFSLAECPSMRILILKLLGQGRTQYGDLNIGIIQLGACVVMLRVNGGVSVEMYFFVLNNHWHPYSWGIPSAGIRSVAGIVNEAGDDMRLTNITRQARMAEEGEGWARDIINYIDIVQKETTK